MPLACLNQVPVEARQSQSLIFYFKRLRCCLGVSSPQECILPAPQFGLAPSRIRLIAPIRLISPIRPIGPTDTAAAVAAHLATKTIRAVMLLFRCCRSLRDIQFSHVSGQVDPAHALLRNALRLHPEPCGCSPWCSISVPKERLRGKALPRKLSGFAPQPPTCNREG